MMTTDESNNGYESKLNESIFVSDYKPPNQEYCQEPLTFKGRKKKTVNRHGESKSGKVCELSVKLDEMA